MILLDLEHDLDETPEILAPADWNIEKIDPQRVISFYTGPIGI